MEGAAKALERQRLPLASGAQDVHDGLEHQPGWLCRATCPGCAFVSLLRIAHWLRHQWLNPFPELVRYFPRMGMRFGHTPLLRRITGDRVQF
jgi:hypothetical protein